MTLTELLAAGYGWAAARSGPILVSSALFPVVGTLLARIGKAGRTDRDGRFIASAVVGLAMAAFLAELFAVAAGYALGRSPFDADAMLLAAPLVCLAASLIGMRWVFPLSELGSVRTAFDFALLGGACAGVLWLLSKFRGWGILFLGDVGQLAAIAVFAGLLLWRLWRRAFRRPGAT